MLAVNNIMAFAAFAALIVMIPGPSIAFIVGRGIALGRKAALVTVLGNTAGAVVQISLVAAGLTPLLERSPTTYTIVRFIGGAYLVVLGIRALRTPVNALEVTAEHAIAKQWQWAREGFVVGITNPKLAVFMAATLPQFVDTETGNLAVQVVILGATFALIALICDGAWALAAGSARDWFGRSPKRIHSMQMAGGTVMIAVGLLAVV